MYLMKKEMIVAKRRGHGEGSIFFRKDIERWVGEIDLGYINGKRQRKQVYGKTQKEVSEKLLKLNLDKQQGLPIKVEKQTVEQFLTRWLEDIVEPTTRPATFRSYEQLTRLHLIPTLGRHQLKDLTPQHVQMMLKEKRTSGLSPRTVQRLRDVLRNALNVAVRRGDLVRNVASLTEPPRVEEEEKTYLTPEQAKHFLQVAQSDQLAPLYVVALYLGLRKGEVLGLKWEQVDLEHRTLSVVGALQEIRGKLQIVKPKTKKSIRTLPLPGAVVQALRDHRLNQAETQLRAGGTWTKSDFVFTTSKGTPINPSNLTRSFHALLKKAGLPQMPFHNLRHTCASLLASQGVSQRVAMEILGHSDIRLTQNIYTHVYDPSKREAVDAMDRLLGDDWQEHKKAS
jgi:integrase